MRKFLVIIFSMCTMFCLTACHKTVAMQELTPMLIETITVKNDESKVNELSEQKVKKIIEENNYIIQEGYKTLGIELNNSDAYKVVVCTDIEKETFEYRGVPYEVEVHLNGNTVIYSIPSGCEEYYFNIYNLLEN